MPHKVTNFLRSSSNSLEAQVSNLKKAAASGARRGTNTTPGSSSRSSRSSERAFSYASSVDDDADEAHEHSQAMKMMTASPRSPAAAMDSKHEPHPEPHHRLSFGGLHFGRSSKESHANPNASLECKIESPPIVFYGDAENSSGALVSGQLFLIIKEGFQMESFNATLNIHVTQKRPFTVHCSECTNQYTEISKWEFLTTPLAMTKGKTFLAGEQTS